VDVSDSEFWSSGSTEELGEGLISNFVAAQVVHFSWASLILRYESVGGSIGV
jgi:hypothetical protein